jgi:hypothetical protein
MLVCKLCEFRGGHSSGENGYTLVLGGAIKVAQCALNKSRHACREMLVELIGGDTGVALGALLWPTGADGGMVVRQAGKCVNGYVAVWALVGVTDSLRTSVWRNTRGAVRGEDDARGGARCDRCRINGGLLAHDAFGDGFLRGVIGDLVGRRGRVGASLHGTCGQ